MLKLRILIRHLAQFSGLRYLGFVMLGLLLGGFLGAGCAPFAFSQSSLADRCSHQADFVWVPGGEFRSGSDRSERDYAYRISAEALGATAAAVTQAEQQLRERRWFEPEPESAVESLPGFCIAKNLVTNADYQTFVRATGQRSPGISAADYQAQGFLVHPYQAVVPYLWQEDQYPPQQGNHPVVLVSYADALAYARWRSQQEGLTYRLPTALEWEKAARSTDGRYFPWGDSWRDDATQWAQSMPQGTSMVGAYSLSRSPYGAEDMAGNVFEFTATQQTRQNQTVVVMKGCSWDDLPGFCRAAYRHTRPPESRHILFGFRLVMA